MKVKVTGKAYYNGSVVNKGDIIDYKGKNLPSWATLVDGVETKKNNKNKEKKIPEQVQNDNKLPVQDDGVKNNGEGEKTPDFNGEKTENGEGETTENSLNETIGELQEELEKTGNILKESEQVQKDVDREEYLNQLISEGIEKDILIEDSDKKTVEEQIKELEEALKIKGE